MKKLSIFFTSDIHGYLFPTDYADTSEKPMGLLRAAAAFERGGNSLIIDGGDTLQGSPFTTHLYESGDLPGVIARSMNLAGYQYVTLGNHDFGYGLEILESYLAQLDALCVCANIRDKAGKLPIHEYAIHTLENGLRVGITGVSTHYVRIWEKKETLDQLIIEEPLPAARRALEKMQGKADIFVCIYHGGFERDLGDGRLLTDSKENQACELCDTLGFDVVLTGHQHMAVDCVRLGGSVAVQPSCRAPHYARVDIEAEGNEKRIDCRLCPPAEYMLPGSEEFLPVENSVQKWLDMPKGRLDVPLPSGDHLYQAVNGCLLANFINSVQREVTGAQISATSMANDVAGMNTEVRVRDVVASYVYDNTLVVKEMTGAELKAYVERCAEYFDVRDGELVLSDTFLKPKIEHYNYDHFSGMDYEIDASLPVGSRVLSMRLNGREITPEQKVSVCVNNYRASGTGGYEMVKTTRTLREYQDDMCALLIDYVGSHDLITIDQHRWLTVRY